MIGAAVLLLFGATKLPKLGQGLGEGFRNFKKGITGELTESDETSDASQAMSKGAAVKTPPTTTS